MGYAHLLFWTSRGGGWTMLRIGRPCFQSLLMGTYCHGGCSSGAIGHPVKGDGPDNGATQQKETSRLPPPWRTSPTPGAGIHHAVEQANGRHRFRLRQRAVEQFVNGMLCLHERVVK